MTPKHTPEPWQLVRMVTGKYAGGIGIKPIDDLARAHTVVLPGGPSDFREANAARIVACVNACAGLNPEAIPALVEAVESLSLIVGQADGANAVKVLRSMIYPVQALTAALAAVRGEK